jgi:RNA recognition motif-containing protein
MDLQKLAEDVVKNDILIKKIELQLKSDKKNLIEAFDAESVISVKIKGKTLTLATRSNKKYINPEIAELELQLKELKAIADIRGQFEVESVTRFIQVR